MADQILYCAKGDAREVTFSEARTSEGHTGASFGKGEVIYSSQQQRTQARIMFYFRGQHSSRIGKQWSEVQADLLGPQDSVALL